MPRSKLRTILDENKIRMRAQHLGKAWNDLPPEEKIERLLLRIKALEAVMFADDTKGQKIARIKYLVAKHYGVSLRLMMSDSHQPRYAWPRHVAIWMCSELLNCTQVYLAEMFNRRDHTTMRHAMNCVEARRVTEPKLNESLRVLRLQIEADIFPLANGNGSTESRPTINSQPSTSDSPQ